MSSTMADALSKVGLITEQEKYRLLADQAHSIAEREALWKKTASMGNQTEHLALVQNCSAISEFKDSARKLLCEYPELAGDVVKASQRFKEQKGGDKLVCLCGQVETLLRQIQPTKRERFLKRAFRCADSTVPIHY